MFTGAQISLYPMTDDFVGVILGSLKALDPYRAAFRIETDDISTLLVGPAEQLFPAMRDLHVAASKGGVHTVLSGLVSRGCPGEPDDPRCTPISGGTRGSLAERASLARASLAKAPFTGQSVSAQFSLYPLGEGHHMDEIYACIDFIKLSGVFERSKNFCTKLRGDAGPVFATMSESFLRFGSLEGHVAVDLTVSANSPSIL